MLTTEESKNLEKENTVLTKVRISYRDIEENVLKENNLNDNEIQGYLKTKLGYRVLRFISAYVNVGRDDVRSLYLISSFNVDTLPLKTYKAIINVCKININKHIDHTLEAVNKKLATGSYYIGCADTYDTRKVERIKRFGFFSSTVGFYDFVIHRVFAKLNNHTKKLYLKISGKSNLSMSQTEVLGRLCRAGFDIVEYKIIQNKFWYVVRKIDKPDTEPVLDYGMLFVKRCVGQYGSELDIVKIRTMHPYAEFLQPYLIRKHGYSQLSNGKIKDDFRVTRWGHILRKLYIDELPQIWNVFKGDMALVGVRPITRTRLREFPENLVIERQKCKPGCIPPYISLKMGDELGNMQAEWIYLKDKQKNGKWTDLRYFFMGVYNLISGQLWSA